VASFILSARWPRTLERMDLRHPTSFADRCVLALAGGCFGLVLGALLSFVVLSVDVIWYTATYFALVCFLLGPVAADIVALVFSAVALLAAGAVGVVPNFSYQIYEKNPFNKPWHWVLFGLFVLGFILLIIHAAPN